MLTFASNTQSAECEPRRITVPDDFETIQEAISNATSGDTIFVRMGIYAENITLNKTVTLIGEYKWATFIFSSWILVHANNTVIKNFTIQLEKGIEIKPTFASFEPGNVTLTPPPTGNLVEDNNIIGGVYSSPCISLASSINNIVRNNNLHFRGTSGVVISKLQLTTMYGSVTGSPSSGNIIENNNMTCSGIGGTAEGGGATVLRDISFNNTVQNNNIFLNQRTLGIFLLESFENKIIGNNIVNGSIGIWLVEGAGNTISHNAVIDNVEGGVWISTDGSNIFRNNNVSGSRFNLFLWGGLNQEIDSSNFVNGKPIIWWVNKTDEQVPLNAGFVVLINCTNIRVENLNITDNSHGIILANTTDSTLKGNVISFNFFNGIYLLCSNSNRILDNSVSFQRDFGIYLDNSCNNTIYHNIFYKNAWDASSDYESFNNLWDNDYPSGGNYWTDYTGKDEKSGPNQDQLGSDGIGDVPYVIDEENVDGYPLIIGRDYGQFTRSYYELNWTVELLPPSVKLEYNGTETILRYNGTEGAKAILSAKFNYPYEDPYTFYYAFMWSAAPEFRDKKATARYSLEMNWTTPDGKVYPIWDQHWWRYKMTSFCGLQNPYYNSTIDPTYERYYPSGMDYEQYFQNQNKPGYDLYTNWTSLLRLEKIIGSHIPTWATLESNRFVRYPDPWDTIRLGYLRWESQEMIHDLFSSSGDFTINLYVCFHPTVGMQNGSCTVRVTSSTIYAERYWVQVHPIQIENRTFNIVTKSGTVNTVVPLIDVTNVKLEQNILKLDVLSSSWLGGRCTVGIPNELMWCLNSTDWRLRWTYYGYHYEGIGWPSDENGTHTFFDLSYFGPYMGLDAGVHHFEIQSTYVLPGFQFNAFDVVWNETSYQIYAVSNSTVSNFQLDTEQKIISFNVSGDYPTTGFCKVTIPNIIIQEMWQGNYTLLLNGEPWSFTNWTDSINTHIYFTYQHSEHEITIIPEFPMLIPLLALIFTTLTAIITKKKLHKILSNKTKTIQNH